MVYRMNKRMKDQLDSMAYDFKSAQSLPERLQNLMVSPIIIDHECVLLKEICEGAPDGLSETEKCEYEWSENHFHPDYFMEDVQYGPEYLKVSLECVRQLIHRLELFEGNKFRIVFSYNEDTYEGSEKIIYESSTISFYQCREGTDDLMKLKDLDSLDDTMVCEIEVG